MHKIVLVKGALQPSVSKVNERLQILLAFGWAAIFVLASLVILFPVLLGLDAASAACLQVGWASFALIFGDGWIWRSPLSDVTDRAYHKATLEKFEAS
ncbi:hypothetical protein [Sphingobium sp. Z007]|uniref:hypothetical protein n=1 Tax=Sphingobium sp. Z007 TaxID=627495 RepID=UPI000B49755A|nr:hypothetical protein [Sphingobium sp. Z007]